MINFFFHKLIYINMTTFAQRLARRTKNTFAPAKRLFAKAVAEAPGIFKKVEGGTQKFFTKTLPTVGRQIGRGLEQVGGTMSNIAGSPLGMALAVAQPELAPAILGLGAAGQGVRQVGGVSRQVANLGKGLSKDATTAQNQILERIKPIDQDSQKITFQ